MADGDQQGQGQPEEASGLRKRLDEQAQETNRYKQMAAEAKATEVLGSGQFHLVEAADLKGLDPEKIEERAKEIQSERAGIFRKGIEAQFRNQGLTGDDLDQAVNEFLAQQERPSAAGGDEQDAYARVSSIGAGGGAPPPIVDVNKLNPEQKIEHGLRMNAARRKQK